MTKRASLMLVLCLCLACNQRKTAVTKQSDLFPEITPQTKIHFTQNPGVDGTYFMPESIGSGIALFDYNNDGRLDAYFVQEGSHKNRDASSKDRLFEQQKDGSFLDVTQKAGLNDTAYGTGIAAGDIDNDGDLDLYVANFGHDVLYRNNGDASFSNVTESAGIKTSGWSSSVAFVDYDLDGYLDLYVVTYLNYDPSVHCSDRAGRAEYCGPKGFTGTSDILFHNNKNGTFTDVSASAGIAETALKGLGLVTADFNGDSYPDIYVANDGERNNLWINQKDGTFKDEGERLGAAVNGLGQPEGSMGVSEGDVDGDGDLDLFMTHLGQEKNTLYRNLDQSGFQDDSWASGLAAPSIPFTGFGTAIFDFDNDGDLDIAVVNGRIARGTMLVKGNASGYWDPYAEPNFLFANDGSGHFKNISDQASAFCATIESSRALAFGDLDNDGDLDLVTDGCGSPARVYRNDAPRNAHWLGIRVLDPGLHRDAIGAELTLLAGGRRIVRTVAPAYSYLCSNDPRVHFGLGAINKVDELIVRWPGGRTESFKNLPVDRFITIEKGHGSQG